MGKKSQDNYKKDEGRTINLPISSLIIFGHDVQHIEEKTVPRITSPVSPHHISSLVS